MSTWKSPLWLRWGVQLQIYSFFKLGGQMDESVTPHPVRFTSSKETRNAMCSGLKDPRSHLDVCGKTRPHLHSLPRPFSLWRIAILSTLCRPTEMWMSLLKKCGLIFRFFAKFHMCHCLQNQFVNFINLYNWTLHNYLLYILHNCCEKL